MLQWQKLEECREVGQDIEVKINQEMLIDLVDLIDLIDLIDLVDTEVEA
jgi:hypothetical protein